MSVEATAAVWAMPFPSETGTPAPSTLKLVAVRIADHADPEGRNAWPSIRRLVLETGLSERAVQGAIRRLESIGVLRRDPVRGPHGTNRYSLDLAWKGAAVAPAASAPPPEVPPQEMHPPAAGAPQGGSGCTQPPQQVHPNRPRTVSEPSREPPQPPRSAALAVVDAKPAVVDDVTTVWNAWVDSTGRKRSVLDDRRRRIIRTALKTYPTVDLVDAVHGWKLSPHHRGENEAGTVYNDVELILRDAQHIEKFRDLQRGLLTPRIVARGKGGSAVDRARERRAQ